MALSATPAPRIHARASHSMFSDRRTVKKLVTAFVLARMSLLVLSGRASVTVACLSHDHDRAHHRCTAGRRLEVVLAGSSHLDTASMWSAHDAVQQQEHTPVQDVVALRRVPDLQASETALPGSASAMQASSATLVVAGLIGLLGVAGAAGLLVHSITGPVRRAVRVLHAPAERRPDQRLRLTPRYELPDMSRAPATGGGGLLDAVRETGTDRSPKSVVASAGAEQVRSVPAIAPDVAETRSVLPEIARVVREARLAHDATIEAARAGGADTGSALIAKGAEGLPRKAGEVMISTPAPRSVGTARYTAARGRALGPTTALWHAVQLDRLVGEIEGACETTVCGSLVRLTTEQAWPATTRDVCPACAALAH